MPNHFFYNSILPFFQFVHAQKETPEYFTVTCFIKGTHGKKIILQNKPSSGTDDFFHVENYDSFYPSSDSFQFRTLVNEPEWRSISVDGLKGWKSFVAMPGEQIKIIGQFDSLYKSKIIGSKEDSLFKVIMNKVIIPLEMARGKSSPDSFKNIYPEIIRKAKYDFIKSNPGSFIAAKFLVEDYSYIRTEDTSEIRFLQKCYLALSPAAKKFTCSKNAYYNLFVANQKLLPGNRLPNFSFTNYDSTKFDLQNSIRKDDKEYYLIDFWATWCGPCIGQFPKLRELYNRFNEKGFEIISYSLDVNKESLEKFLLKEKLAWKDYSDLKGDQSPVYRLFKLGTIPANFLIDKSGLIIGMNLKPDDLENILEKRLDR